MKHLRYQAPPLPDWATTREAMREALPGWRPLSRVTVTEVAPRRSIESGGQWTPWRPDVAPYMNEPADLTTSRRFESIAFVGPARCSKSEGLVINPLVHAILAQPRVVAVFSPSKDAAQEWSVGALDPLIWNSPELRSRLATGKGGDNVFTKRFRGGARVTIDWPVKSKLAQRSIGLVIGTDYDAFPEDVGGDGDAFAMMRKRTESAGSRGMTIVESSPRKPVNDETWTAKTPHEAPPCDGILEIYNRGSRGRLYWTCRDCGHEFQPAFDLLAYPDEGSPAERGQAAYMGCPACGSVIEARDKPAMNRAAKWLHECDGGALVPIGDLKRMVATASYWLPGPAAAIAPWSRLVMRVLEAEETYRTTGGETALQATYNVELGLPYLPRARGTSANLSAGRLRDLASHHAWQRCPEGTRFVTVAVDVQAGHFVVQVEAWLARMERVVIDRFDIVTSPASEAASRRLDPGGHAEDWEALEALTARAYPVEGEGHALQPVGVIIDALGEPGVTPNARAFWRRMRKHQPKRFWLRMGRGGDNARRAVLSYPDSAHQGKKAIVRDVPVIFIGTDRLKDEVSASLLREDAGPGKLHISAHAPAAVFEEFAAERREKDGWKKKPGVRRNEALDLSVYALGLAITLKAEAIDYDRPPPWATAGPTNSRAVVAVAPAPKASGDGAADEAAPAAAAPAPAPAGGGVITDAEAVRPAVRPKRAPRRIGYLS